MFSALLLSFLSSDFLLRNSAAAETVEAAETEANITNASDTRKLPRETKILTIMFTTVYYYAIKIMIKIRIGAYFGCSFFSVLLLFLLLPVA